MLGHHKLQLKQLIYIYNYTYIYICIYVRGYVFGGHTESRSVTVLVEARARDAVLHLCPQASKAAQEGDHSTSHLKRGGWCGARLEHRPPAPRGRPYISIYIPNTTMHTCWVCKHVFNILCFWISIEYIDMYETSAWELLNEYWIPSTHVVGKYSIYIYIYSIYIYIQYIYLYSIYSSSQYMAIAISVQRKNSECILEWGCIATLAKYG